MTTPSLSSLEPAPRAKSKAAQISELLPEIEAALAAGCSHKTIFEHIKRTLGLNLTFGYYENTLHRIRQRQDSPAPTHTAGRLIKAKPHTLEPGARAVPAAPAIDGATSLTQGALFAPIDDFFS